MSARPRVFSIASGVPFVDALAGGILSGAMGIDAGDPLALSEATLLLPTRRAGRALVEAFLRRTSGKPLALPRIVPLGEVDEDVLDFAGDLPEGSPEIPPAMPPVRREFLLAKLIADWHKKKKHEPPPPDQLLRFARALARLIDQLHTERLGFDGFQSLVPGDFAEHWQITLDFLDVAARQWPKILAREGALDPAHRRNLLLDAQAGAWETSPPAHPVIAAGSTGSIPATANLLSVIARLPKGAVVLPGLDRRMDDEAWGRLDEMHPQFTMARLLERLQTTRALVKDWEHPGVESPAPERAALVSKALLPANATDIWAQTRRPGGASLENVSRIDCPAPREEAGVIALLMREALETKGKRVALVTPDRGLARRVAAELSRYGLEVDDSGGTPLAETPPGVFLRLTARMAASAFAPVPFLSALKHPLAAGGMEPGAFRGLVREFETDVLRGPRPRAGIAGLRAALKSAKLDPKIRRRFADLLARLDTESKAFVKALSARRSKLETLAAAHVAFAEKLAAAKGEPGAHRLWAGEAGEAASEFMAELAASARGAPALDGAAYPALLEAALEGQVVRPRYGRHPRLFIWGLLEARLQQADRVILAGLNEGTWPAAPEPDPWMSRPMRKQIGLPPPERRIGLSAHDFAQGFCAPEVAMTRSTRVEGTPTVASRWLMRLDAVLGEGREIPRATEYLRWFNGLDAPAKVEPVAPPAPKPPADARPRKLSVTRVETLIRDPYSIFARDILRLRPLDDLDADPGAAERGSFIHEALDLFIGKHRTALPADAAEKLIRFGETAFGDMLERPGVRAFWWPRFVRIAHWFVEQERARRADGYKVLATECLGALEFPVRDAPFTLTAKADRIDEIGGALAILDYKTGTVPSEKQVKSGLTPQLPLEAAIAREGGFEKVSAAPVRELAYVRLTGREPPGEYKPLKQDGPEALAAAAFAKLKALLAKFAGADMPYLSRPRPMFASRFGDYDHLARVKEWSAAQGDDG